MPTPTETLVQLEKKFWQSMVDQDADTAVEMLSEPALMVSAQGTMQFDHADYKRMAEQGDQVLTSYELSDINVTFPNEKTAVVTYHVKQGIAPRGESQRQDFRGSEIQEMNDSSTWVRDGRRWKCVLHTETPVEAVAH